MNASVVFIRISNCLLFVFGAAFTINGILMMFTTNFNIGNILTLGLGAVLLCYAIFFDKINQTVPLALRVAFIVLLMIVLGFSVFLLSFGSHNNTNYKEDAIIVLGAAVHGKTPSVTLADRLDTAAEYSKQNPNALIIVSGGKGPQEDVTEAYAMEKYLIQKGVPKDRIVKEEKSTSTLENFKFSKEILDNTFDKGYTIAFITNEYHIYRAGNIAKDAGFENATHAHCNTRWYALATGTLRECVGVLKYWIID